MRRTPALIVGGGPAGAAAAIVLARAGLPHLLVERQREIGNALCGGFLSWRTLERVRALGIEPDDLHRRRVTDLRIVVGKRSRVAALPRAALAVSRHRLDTLLLDQAMRAGAAIERGVMVRGIEGSSARLQDGRELAADALFLASGKHDVRGIGRPAVIERDPTLGLRVRLGPAAALDRMVGDAIELHLVRGGYAGLVRQEDGSANLCMAIRRSRLHEAGSTEQLLAALAAEAPMLGERLGYRAAGNEVDAIANVPYGWRQRRGVDGLFRLGDQAAVIPSLAGEGIGIALTSGVAAAEAYRRSGTGAATGWQSDFAGSVAGPMRVASAVRATAERPRFAALLPLVPAAMIRIAARATRVG